MSPTRSFDDRSWLARGMVEIVEPGIGIGLQETGIAGQVAGRMSTPAIARIEEYGRRRRGAVAPPNGGRARRVYLALFRGVRHGYRLSHESGGWRELRCLHRARAACCRS
jgi:hypothetical protein